MSTFCEHGNHDVASIREPDGKLVPHVKACTDCTPDYLAKMLTVKEAPDADASVDSAE